MPSEREICEEYGLSRVTVRKALENLVNEGFLKKVKGKGTLVVNSFNKQLSIDQSTSFYNFFVKKGYDVKTKIIEFKTLEPTNIIRNLLKLNIGEKVFKIKRLRILNSEPFYHAVSYIPYKYLPYLKVEEIQAGSQFELFKNKYNINLIKARRYLYTDIAKKEDAKLLGIDIGTAIQVFENISYLENSEPFEYSRSVFKYDKIVFEVEINNINTSKSAFDRNEGELFN